jgi:GNAT superfamily N-acetyltransferase
MVDPTSGRRIEKSFASQGRDYATDHRLVMPEHGAEVLDVGGAGGGVAVWGSKHGAPNVSRAFALGIDGEVTEHDLASVEAFYARHGAPVRVVTSPWTHRSLFVLLAARSYRVIGFDNVLTRVLAKGDHPKIGGATAPGVAVRSVGQHEVRAWGEIVRVGFGMAPDDEPSIEADRIFEQSKNATLYVATVDGEPAGGAALDVRDGMATLFATATIPAYRRRGVHGALVAARLAHALEADADLAVVITSPGSDSQRNLETSCGFRVGYSSVLFEAPKIW